MISKQTLFVGGGTVFGAVAAVVLMKALPSGDPEIAETNFGSVEKARGGNPADSATDSERTGVGIEPLSDRMAEDSPAPQIDAAALEERREEFRSEMRERQMARLTDKMGKWSAALGLDQEQQGQLLDLANSQFDEMETMAATVEGGDPATISDKARRAMAIMSGRALEESMIDLLTPAQKAKHQEFEDSQTQNRAEAGALRQLATLQEDLMLTPEQRNDAYGIIYADQLQQATEDSDVSSMIKQFASQSGVSLDPALEAMISSVANQGLEKLASGDSLDGDGIKDLAESILDSSVEEQVGLLRPVLTEAQLELYRGQLEERFNNFENLIPERSDDQ